MSAAVKRSMHELRRFKREEYHRLAEAGVIAEDERLELLDGMIVRMSPQGARHAAAVSLVESALRGVVGAGMHVRTQLPLAVSDDSEPEPDVAVVSGSPRDYVDEHPRTALLVAEVAHESLEIDRSVKPPFYARAGIPEYWVVNLLRRELEVHRDPVAPQAGHPAFYRERTVFTEGDAARPSFAPDRSIPVRDLLP